MKRLVTTFVALFSSLSLASPCANLSQVNLGYSADLEIDINNDVHLMVTHPRGATEWVYCGEQTHLQCHQPESGQVFPTIHASGKLTVTYNNYGRDEQVFACPFPSQLDQGE